jgi:CBS-domain-containing membrane protein
MREQTIREVMTTDVVSVPKDAPFKDVVEILSAKHVSGAPVVDADGVVIGVVSETDLLPRRARPAGRASRIRLGRLASHGRGGTTAAGVMTAPAVTVRADAPVPVGARLVLRRGVKRLPVVDDRGRLVGIVSPRDLLRAFLRPDTALGAEITEQVFRHALGMVVTPATVTVDVHDGVVTLRGQVDRKSQIPVAVAMTAQVDGVVDVVDELGFAFDDSRFGPADEVKLGLADL